MDDVAHVGLVDAHAEGVRGHHDGNAVVDERFLALATVGVAHTGVVAPHGNPLRHELEGELLAELVHRLAGGAIDDAAFLGMLAHVIQDPAHLGLLAHLFHAKVEVRAVEARYRGLGIAKPQHGDDIRAHTLRGGGSKGGEHRPHGQRVYELSDLQVRGTKVLAPLAHAMRLVHGDERDAQTARCGHRLGERQKARVFQTLRGHVHDLIPAFGRAFEHRVLLGRREA